METFKTEGVIINALPFQNYDCLLTVFTPLDGLIKLFFRGAYRHKKGQGSGITTPFSLVEIVYRKGKGELFSCSEITVIQHHLSLRRDLSLLEAACDMLSAISSTQQPEKSAEELYQLFIIYLNKLPLVSQPQTLLSSFKLKLLRYEGLLAYFSHCSMCANALQDAWIYKNEAFCLSHVPLKTLYLTKEERIVMEHLTFCRDISLFSNLKIGPPLSKKISHLFEESFKKLY